MPKECAIDVQKQLRLLVEMSSTLAEEERLVLTDPQTSHNVPLRKTCSISNWSKEPLHGIGQGEKGTGKMIVDA